MPMGHVLTCYIYDRKLRDFAHAAAVIVARYAVRSAWCALQLILRPKGASVGCPYSCS